MFEDETETCLFLSLSILRSLNVIFYKILVSVACCDVVTL